jgi:hypothetical protein
MLASKGSVGMCAVPFEVLREEDEDLQRPPRRKPDPTQTASSEEGHALLRRAQHDGFWYNFKLIHYRLKLPSLLFVFWVWQIPTE